MKRAALYARVSTERQKDEKTIETQINEIKAAIKADGCALIADCIYKDDGWSGAFLERPDLDRLRQDAKENKFDVLYVYDRGRLSRKFVYQEIVIEELTKSSIEFKSLHDINGKNPEEQLMGGVMGIFHEYERVKIAERFRLGKLNKVRSGKLLGYQPCYGYDYVPIQGHGTSKKNGYFVINEAEAKVVKMIYEWVGIEGVSLREVRRRLYEMGIPPKKNKRAYWTEGPIDRLLRNETYIGKHYYYKNEAVQPKNPKTTDTQKYRHRHTNKTSRKLRDKSEWLMVKVPRIIEDELFEKVQKQLEQNMIHSQRNRKHPYLFSGLVWCECGHKRAGDGPKDKKYYRCAAGVYTFPLPNTCKSGGVNAAVLDAVGWQQLENILTKPELIENQIKNYATKKVVNGKKEPDESQILQNLKTLDEEERRYVKMYGQGMMSEDVYEEQMQSLIKRREELRKLLSKPEDDKLAKFRNIDAKAVSQGFSEFIGKLSFEDKVFTVRKIVDRVIATKEVVTMVGFIPILAMEPARGAGLSANDSDFEDSNTPNKVGKVGLRAKYRHSWVA